MTLDRRSRSVLPSGQMRRPATTGQLAATANYAASETCGDPREILKQGLIFARSRAMLDGAARVSFARAIAHATITTYWDATFRNSAKTWSICDLPSSIDLGKLTPECYAVAKRMGLAAGTLDVSEASYRLGLVYTALLPDAIRADLGAYYTPPALCERLLDMAEEAGVDWRTARVLDPACGGGAFLSPVASRMASSLKDCSPKIALKNILHRLHGFEMDPFAAWMSRVFLEVTLAQHCRAAGIRLPSLIEECDSLRLEPGVDRYDLVVGNPPYGRVKLSAALREKYRRSLYGHANLYGLFTDLALHFARPGGVIAYVTPTSFLAGEYFKALRGLLAREAPPVSIEFVSDRKGVFADVLQETMLAAYRRAGATEETRRVHFFAQAPDGEITATQAGSFRLPKAPDEPWIVPRARRYAKLVRGVERMQHRLSDYGYKVSTGPLVWNRHKSSLRDRPGKNRYPLIWAESVRANGSFEFRAQKRNHQPYFEPLPFETWVVTEFPCVLLQRTTAKEQLRRLIAAEMPAFFVAAHGGVVVENHLNMVRPINGAPLVSSTALAALLNTSVVDAVFRCISGSVAVSAYELESLPLPAPDAMAEIERLAKWKRNNTAIERAARRLYGEGPT